MEFSETLDPRYANATIKRQITLRIIVFTAGLFSCIEPIFQFSFFTAPAPPVLADYCGTSLAIVIAMIMIIIMVAIAATMIVACHLQSRPKLSFSIPAISL